MDLQAALDALPAGASLTLPAGTYRLDAPLRLNHHLVGTGQTLITRPRTPHTHLVEVLGEATLENLTLAWADDGTYCFQSDVLVVSGKARLVNCRLQGSPREPADMTGGAGLRNAGSTHAEGCEFTGHGGHGIHDTGTLDLRDCWISGNRGMGILTGGTVNARNLTILENDRGGITSSGDLTLENPTIQANRRFGVQVEGGTLTITGGSIRENGGNGVQGSDTKIILRDLMIEANHGFGVAGANVELSNVAIAGNGRGSLLP